MNVLDLFQSYEKNYIILYHCFNHMKSLNNVALYRAYLAETQLYDISCSLVLQHCFLTSKINDLFNMSSAITRD